MIQQIPKWSGSASDIVSGIRILKEDFAFVGFDCYLLTVGSVGGLQKDGEVSQLVDRSERAIATREQYGGCPLQDMLS